MDLYNFALLVTIVVSSRKLTAANVLEDFIMKVTLDDVFPWYTANNLKEPCVAKIEAVCPVIIGEDDAEKPSLVLEKHLCRVILNKGNTGNLARAFGTDTDNWVGRWVEVTVGPSWFNGETVPGLKVNPADFESQRSSAPNPVEKS